MKQTTIHLKQANWSPEPDTFYMERVLNALIISTLNHAVVISEIENTNICML